MKHLVLLLMTVLFSSLALSGLRVGTPQTNLSTASFPTQHQAAEAGESLIRQLKSVSPNALQYMLPAHDVPQSDKALEIHQLRRSIKPVATDAGQIEFQSIVTVHYSVRHLHE